MDLYEFNLHSLDGRAQLVWDEGNLLVIRNTPESTVLLYHMGKFFAEVWYDKELNLIANIRTFKSQKCLEPYLEQIHLDFFM